jgi:Short C-terminal domain
LAVRKESEPMLRRRRRPLVRAAMVGGAGYLAGRKMGEARDGGPTPEQEADPVPGEAPSSGISDSSIERLKQLATLRDQGVLTDEEFDAEKAKVLGGA